MVYGLNGSINLKILIYTLHYFFCFWKKNAGLAEIYWNASFFFNRNETIIKTKIQIFYFLFLES